MAFVFLFLVAAGLGAYGYYRGAARFGLALLPLLLAAALIWLLGPLIYGIDGLRNAGLIWPGLVLFVCGVSGGYTLQFYCRKRLPKKCHRYDRIGGVAVGLLVSMVLVWIGCVYYVVWSSSNRPDRSTGSAGWLANALNTGVVRWVPGVGSGSDAMMRMVEIATAEEAVRRQAIEDLGLSGLADLPEMQVVLNDEQTQADVQAAAKGNIAAIWRLQKNPHLLRLLETDEVRQVLTARSLKDIAAAVRKARKN